MKQYHVRVTRIYDVFVEAETDDQALLEAEANCVEWCHGIADDVGSEIIDSYPALGEE